METSAPVLHDAILLGAGIAAVYLVVALMQLLQLKSLRAPPRRPEEEPSLGIDVDAAHEEANFASHLEQQRTDVLIKRLQSDVERLGAELVALQHELRRRDENTAPSFTPRPVETATRYNEAMRYALHGMSAVGIAQKCGISLGEAELVVSLSRDTQAGRNHGGHRAAA